MALDQILAYVAVAVVSLALGAFVFLLTPRRKAALEASEQGIPSPPAVQQATLGASLVTAAPRGYIGWIEKQIAYAGRPAGWNAQGVVTWKLILGILGVLIGLLLIFSGPEPLKVMMAVALAPLLFFLPDVRVNSKAHDRQRAITLALPDTLDQMTIAVEAGLGFDSAMAKAARAGQGPLPDELIRVLQDMSIGRTRRDAFRELERRTSSEDLRRFARAITQADAYGVAIGEVLRVQASEMRMKRRQSAEEQAQKVTIKILFPLIFCLLPVMFIVILTPVIIRIIETFSIR